MRERQVDSFMILKKVSHVKSHTEFTSSAQAAHRLPTIQAPTQRSRRQKGDTKPGPYRGPTEIRRQRITFSDRGGVARLWCTPVPLYVTHRHAFVGIKKLQNQHTKTLRTAVTPQGCVPPRSTQCFGQEFCVGISEGAHWKHEGLIMLDLLRVCLLQPQQAHFSNNQYGRNTATDAAHRTATSHSSSP